MLSGKEREMDKKSNRKWVLAIVFVIVCGAVGLFLHYGQQKKRLLIADESAETVTSYVQSSGPAPALGAQETAEVTEEVLLCVHICGAVKEEGVYRLSEDSRLQDGIIAAGGFREDADTTYHNLAARLKDGQRVYVPTKEETQGFSSKDRITTATDVFATDGANGSGPVNLNTAGLEELMSLSGIGKAKAESIIKYREKVGLFQSIEEIKNISGIGDAMFERIKEDIAVE